MSNLSYKNANILVLIFLFAIINFVCKAQSNPDVISNETVITMTKAGLPKSVILAKIQSSNTNFDVSVDAMINLKKQGVDDDVLTAMATKGSSGNIVSANSLNAAGASKTEIMLSNAEPGIYYSDKSTGEPVELDASVFTASKSGSGIFTAITYGIAKTKVRAVLSGSQSNFQVNEKNPVFYFVFPHRSGNNLGNESSGITGWYNNASSPNEFMLIQFKVKSNSREVVTGSFGTYSGFSEGVDEDSKIPYRSIKIAPGLYKVYFETLLGGGEYAFVFAGTAAQKTGETPTQKAFDFSMKGNPNSTNQSQSSDPRSRPAPPNPLKLFKKKPNQDTTKNGN